VQRAQQRSVGRPQDLALEHAQDPFFFFLQIPHPNLTSFRGGSHGGPVSSGGSPWGAGDNLVLVRHLGGWRRLLCGPHVVPAHMGSSISAYTKPASGRSQMHGPVHRFRSAQEPNTALKRGHAGKPSEDGPLRPTNQPLNICQVGKRAALTNTLLKRRTKMDGGST
jgi:hypothetical protein